MTIHKGGYLIKYLREKQGLGQIELAKEIKISQSHLSDIERNTKTPGSEVLKKLADRLGFQMEEFFEGKKF